MAISVRKTPNPANTTITSPNGSPPGAVFPVMFWYVGRFKAGGSVKVGSREGCKVKMNCAASVGSIVLVIAGVAVAGGSSSGIGPPIISTLLANTQPLPPGPPGYSIWIYWS